MQISLKWIHKKPGLRHLSLVSVSPLCDTLKKNKLQIKFGMKTNVTKKTNK